MEVYSLIGTSGTGKSYNAISFAYEHNIKAIIDDGLLIYDGKRVAGTSAKFEKTMIAAVKRAIFLDDEAAKEVIEKIKELEIDRILIIGTSQRMVNKIATRLNISPIDHQYFIEQILPAEEIERAKHERTTKGTHIIPLSYKQLDQNVFQKIIQKGIDIFSPHKEKIGETTIVRPHFHRRLLARLRKAKAKQKAAGTYRSRRRYIYIESMKVQYAKLIPELLNFIHQQLLNLKEIVSNYYDKTKHYLYVALVHVLAYAYNLLKYVVKEYEALLVT